MALCVYKVGYLHVPGLDYYCCVRGKQDVSCAFSRPWECPRRLFCATSKLFRHGQTMQLLMVSYYYDGSLQMYVPG